LIESFPLKKNDIISREFIEKSKILFQGPRIEADLGLYPFGLQIGNILKHPIPTGRYGKTLNQE
jgi:hypothetical protein